MSVVDEVSTPWNLNTGRAEFRVGRESWGSLNNPYEEKSCIEDAFKDRGAELLWHLKSIDFEMISEERKNK